MDARQRVEAVVAVARRIADPSDRLGALARQRLAGLGGLSPQGIELAMTEHLETEISPGELDRFVASAQAAGPVAGRCHVILSANVCTAAMRAIAWALAGSPQVLVKPSRRDPVLAEIFAAELGAIGVRLGDYTSSDAGDSISPEPGDSVHVYGSDETIRAIAETLPADTELVAHGTGFGVAVGSDAIGIADDLVPFDGRGCLSPRLVIAEADPRALGHALHAELLRRGDAVPRGPLSSSDRAELTRMRQSFLAVGEALVGPHHAVFIDPAPEAIALAPAARATVVMAREALPLLAGVAHHVTAIGGDGGDLHRGARDMCPAARISPLGRMQKPALDGPVDLR